MTAEDGTLGRLLVVGANFRSAEVELRDRLFLDDAAQTAFLERLRDEAGLSEAMILCTCDRVEVQGIAVDPPRAAARTADMLAAGAGLTRADLSGRLFDLTGEAALMHVFAIPAGLDSQLVGEAHVMGQVREAHARARDRGLVGSELEQVLQAAYASAKRIRGETGLGDGAVSLAAAATHVARDLFGDLSGVKLLVIGLGDVGELMLQHFRQIGVASAELTGPSRRTPQEAARLGVAHRALEDLPAALTRADIVVSDTGLGRTMISAPVLRAALKARRYRPVLVIDGAVPPDVDPAVERLEQAFLYRLEDIERLAMEGRRGREQAAEAARRILAEEAAQFRKRGAAREAVPALVALRRHFEQEREAVLAAHPNADGPEATRLLLQRLLHGPSTALRELAEAGEAADFKDWVTVNRVLQRLFALDKALGADAPHEEPGDGKGPGR